MAKIKIGVLSDSHKKEDLQQAALKHCKALGANHIIHAGDFSLLSNLKSLHAFGLPYTAVYGNNDHRLQMHEDFQIFKEPHYFKLQGISFKLMHLPFYLSGDVDVVIFGHTHAFECEKKGKTLFLNPGEVCGRNKPLSEYALLEVNAKKYKVTYFYKDLQFHTFNQKEFIYER